MSENTYSKFYSFAQAVQIVPAFLPQASPLYCMYKLCVYYEKHMNKDRRHLFNKYVYLSGITKNTFIYFNDRFYVTFLFFLCWFLYQSGIQASLNKTAYIQSFFNDIFTTKKRAGSLQLF